MTDLSPHHDVPAPAKVLAGPVMLWGSGTALLACSVAWNRGVLEGSIFGILPVIAAALVGFSLLTALRARPIGNWALPVLMSQMVRTLLAPALGLGVFLLIEVDALGYWLSLLAVAGAMLVGETIAVAKMFGSVSAGSAGAEDRQEVVA